MASLDHAHRFVPLTLFVLPLIVVKLTAALLGGASVRQANALSPKTSDMQSSESTATVALSNGTWPAAQQAAAAHVRMLASTSFGPTPMLHVERPETIEPAPIVVEPVAVAPEIPQFTLYAVISTTAGDHAVIDNRPYKQGDIVQATNWIVQVIDIDRGEVVLAERDSTRTTRIAVIRRQ